MGEAIPVDEVVLGGVYDPFKKCWLRPGELVPAAESLSRNRRGKNAERALWYYDRAAERYPGSVRIACGRCNALATLERYDEAHDALDGAMAKNPEDPLAAITMVNLLRAEERHKEALELAEASFGKRPGRAVPEANLPALRRRVVLEERRLRMVDRRLLKDPDELVRAANERPRWVPKDRGVSTPEPAKVVVLAGEYAAMHLEKCKILNGLSRHEEALVSAERSLRHARDLEAAVSRRLRNAPGGSGKAGYVNHGAADAIVAEITALVRLGRHGDALARCRDALEEFGSVKFFERTMARLRNAGSPPPAGGPEARRRTGIRGAESRPRAGRRAAR